MKFLSLFTRLGLVALGFILVAIVNDDEVWSNPSTTSPTTSGLADSMLNKWGLALAVLGLLMAMAMKGLHTSFVMSEWKIYCGSLEVKKND